MRVNGVTVKDRRTFLANSPANGGIVSDDWSLHELVTVPAGSAQTVQVFATVLSSNASPTIANNLNVGQLTVTLLKTS